MSPPDAAALQLPSDLVNLAIEEGWWEHCVENAVFELQVLEFAMVTDQAGREILKT